MRTDLKEFPVSDQLERRLIRQAPRNLQIPHKKPGGPSNTKKFAAGSLGFVQTLLKSVFHAKSEVGSKTA